MADVNENVVASNDNGQAQAQTTAPEISPELKQWMDYSVHGKAPEVATQEAQETQVLSNESQAAVSQDAAQTVTATQEVAQQPPVDVFAPFKEKYGYQTPDDVAKDIEEYRKLKENPYLEVEFENEQSRTLYNLIKDGKIKEVYEVLAQQERLESLTSLEVNKDNAADIIKYGMQLKYKDLSPSEIEFQFRKEFSYPKEPVQRADELDEEFEARKQEWREQVSDIDTSKIIKAKLFKPELDAAKANIKLPEVENNVDEAYAQWRKSLEEQPKIDAQTKEAYQSFKPEALKTEMDFNDEANNVHLKFEFIPDVEGFEATRELVADGGKLLEAYRNQDGTPNRGQFLRDLYYGRNIQKVLTEAMKQAKNAVLKAQLPDNVNGTGLNRQNAQTQEPSEFDTLMRASLSVR